MTDFDNDHLRAAVHSAFAKVAMLSTPKLAFGRHLRGINVACMRNIFRKTDISCRLAQQDQRSQIF